jgi:hypothetical protein
MIASPPGVDLGHAARISTVIGCDVMLVIARPKASPDVSDSFVRQREAKAALRPVRDIVCHLIILVANRPVLTAIS